MQYKNYAGSEVKVYVQSIVGGVHVALVIDTANTRLSSHPSVVPVVTSHGTGRATLTFSGLSPATNEGDDIECRINGTADGNSFSEFGIPLTISAIERGTDNASTFDHTTDTVSVSELATDVITAASLSSAAIAKFESALMNEGDGNAFIDALVQAIDAADIDTDILPGLVGGWILNRVLAGNHDTAGTVGKLLQNLDALISSRMATTHINATGGKVDGVALVDVTTSNTDMRGTDGAATVNPDNTSITDILQDTGTDIPSLISSLQVVSNAIQTVTDQFRFTNANRVDSTPSSVGSSEEFHAV